MTSDRARAIGIVFSHILLRKLGYTTMCEIVAENQKEGCDEVCASQSHCDANLYMAEAFWLVMGRSVLDSVSDKDADIWNSAWNYAKKNCFFIQLYMTGVETEHLCEVE